MSHITTVKTQLKDGQVLRHVLKKLGYQVQNNEMLSNRGASRRRVKVDLLATKDRLQLGFKCFGSPTERFDIVADWEDLKGCREKVLNEIFQSYSEEKLIKLARLKGYAVVKNRTNQKGQIEIVLRKVA